MCLSLNSQVQPGYYLISRSAEYEYDKKTLSRDCTYFAFVCSELVVLSSLLLDISAVSCATFCNSSLIRQYDNTALIFVS